jgi:hypothetical protein
VLNTTKCAATSTGASRLSGHVGLAGRCGGTLTCGDRNKSLETTKRVGVGGALLLVLLLVLLLLLLLLVLVLLLMLVLLLLMWRRWWVSSWKSAEALEIGVDKAINMSYTRI